MKLKQVGRTNQYYLHTGSYGFRASKTAEGILINAKSITGMTQTLTAKSISEAERKIAAFVKAAQEEVWQERQRMMKASNERWAAQAQAQGCAHEWVDMPVTDHLNIAEAHQCSKCGESRTIPRSN